MSKKPTLPATAVAAYIQEQAGKLLEQRAHVRKERVHGIHDMRVASRRLRVAVREARPLLDPSVSEQLGDALALVTRELGHARELDVMQLMMEEYVKDAYGPWDRAARHAINELRSVREEARHGCAEAMRSVDTMEFEALVQQTVRVVAGQKRAALDTIGPSLVKRLKQFRKSYRDWRETEHNEDLHRARILCKKLRYALEFYAPAYDKRLAKILDEIKAAQEMLGDWHDAVMLCDALRRIEKHAPYREVQGFPLVIEAFHAFGDDKKVSFQHWAKAFFSPSRREEVIHYLLGH